MWEQCIRPGISERVRSDRKPSLKRREVVFAQVCCSGSKKERPSLKEVAGRSHFFVKRLLHRTRWRDCMDDTLVADSCSGGYLRLGCLVVSETLRALALGVIALVVLNPLSLTGRRREWVRSRAYT